MRKTKAIPSTEALIRYFRRVAHDVANPCNALTTHLDLIELQTGDREDVKAVIERARADILRTLGTAKRGVYLPPMPLTTERTDLSPGDLVQHVWAHLAVGDRELDNRIPGDLSWTTSESHLFQALSCVLANAAESGAARVVCDRIGRTQGIRIENRLSEAVDSEAWLEPFFTTKSQQGHLGLGLNVARFALEQIGGRLRLETNGSECRVELVC